MYLKCHIYPPYIVKFVNFIVTYTFFFSVSIYTESQKKRYIEDI